ncbi:MAG: peptide MFS transporter [Clostridioides sp.]|jgi:dipeptide/tripeptide permease|nr:peptide MFS transporter [Clostridioides sp.]
MSTKTAKKGGYGLGYYFCCLTFSFERGAYYGSKFLIYYFLFTAVKNGGLGLTKEYAAMMQANLVAFTYIAPIIGGLISDRWLGGRYCIPIGLIIMAAGYYCGSIATGTGMVWAMIALVSIGTGLFKGQISGVNGQIIADPEKMDSGFSIQYTFVNIGSFVATTAVPLLYLGLFQHGEIQGFSQCFLLAAALCVIGAVWFVIGWRFMGDAGKRPFKEGVVAEKADAEEDRPLTKIEKKRMMAIVLISIFSVIFWLFWYLTYLAVYDYGDAHVNMMIGNIKVYTAWFDSLNALVCIVMGPVLAALWTKLAARPQGDMSLFKKTGIGLAFLGISFLMFVCAELTRGVGAPDTVKASVIWIILFGIFLSFGEMCFSPLGNSFVSKYSPKKYLSVFMGVWTVATFIAAKSYGRIYAFTMKFNFMTVYIVIPIILFIAAIILFASDKTLSKLVVEDDQQAKID